VGVDLENYFCTETQFARIINKAAKRNHKSDETGFFDGYVALFILQLTGKSADINVN
jgi:hypothetical protein